MVSLNILSIGRLWVQIPALTIFLFNSSGINVIMLQNNIFESGKNILGVHRL